MHKDHSNRYSKDDSNNSQQPAAPLPDASVIQYLITQPQTQQRFIDEPRSTATVIHSTPDLQALPHCLHTRPPYERDPSSDFLIFD